jgi:hypothetical protein
LYFLHDKSWLEKVVIERIFNSILSGLTVIRGIFCNFVMVVNTSEWGNSEIPSHICDRQNGKELTPEL